MIWCLRRQVGRIKSWCLPCRSDVIFNGDNPCESKRTKIAEGHGYNRGPKQLLEARFISNMSLQTAAFLFIRQDAAFILPLFRAAILSPAFMQVDASWNQSSGAMLLPSLIRHRIDSSNPACLQRPRNVAISPTNDHSSHTFLSPVPQKLQSIHISFVTVPKRHGNLRRNHGRTTPAGIAHLRGRAFHNPHTHHLPPSRTRFKRREIWTRAARYRDNFFFSQTHPTLSIRSLCLPYFQAPSLQRLWQIAPHTVVRHCSSRRPFLPSRSPVARSRRVGCRDHGDCR